ncbi:PucR family transcriptional regulator [Streptomyces sp. NPDC091292]|uniref:PucR family transcriptional regulator n=1 Tax=Streptomyces sp. NPDC091292 TaxID=3365991 RepID=UPI00382B1483
MEGSSTVSDPTAPPPTPPVPPPTPPVPLAALLARDDLGLRQIAGPPAGTVTILWAHTSEMSDPYPYLLGGELLLTAGVHASEAAGTGPYYDDYVARVVEAGGAALGFGVAPVHDTVPRALVAACERYGLPLVEVPPRTTFSAVTRAVWAIMAQIRHAELRRTTEAQQGLASAAARPDPVPAVLRQLAQRVGGWTALLGPDGTAVRSAGVEPGTAVRGAVADLVRVVTRAGSGAPTSATDTVGGAPVAVYALGGGQGFALGVAGGRREPGDHTVTGVAVVLLSLLTGEHQGAAQAGRSAALLRLLLGAEPHQVVPLLGADTWTVVHGHRGAGPADAVAATALGAALGSSLVDAGPDAVRVLVPADRDLTAQPGWTLGASAPAAAPDLATADAQAARALVRALATREPLTRHHPADEGLASLIPPAEAEAHARALLSPLTNNPALLSTLHTWLSLHGSWDRTAVALGIHRNTVRQRIARCATLLTQNLDDPDTRMELWFALRRTL